MLKNQCANYVQNILQEHFHIFDCPLCLHGAIGMRHRDNKRLYEYSKIFDLHKVEKGKQTNKKTYLEIY